MPQVIKVLKSAVTAIASPQAEARPRSIPASCSDGERPMTRMICCTCNKPIFKGERFSITPSGKRRHKACLKAHMDHMKAVQQGHPALVYAMLTDTPICNVDILKWGYVGIETGRKLERQCADLLAALTEIAYSDSSLDTRQTADDAIEAYRQNS